MVRRVCIGKLPDGSHGLLVSAPGVDVMTANPLDGNQITFNSNWTDMLKVHAIGRGFYNGDFAKVAWPDLGYKPFMEIRASDGAGRVYDDSLLTNVVGPGALIFSDGFRPTQLTSGVTFNYIYVAYKIPAPVS